MIKQDKTFTDVMKVVLETLTLQEIVKNIPDIGKRNIKLLESYIEIFETVKPINLENIKVLHKTLERCLSFVSKEGEDFFITNKEYRIELTNLERIANSPLAEMMYTSLVNELRPLLEKELKRRINIYRPI